jgi:hypothetical protein
MMTASCSFNTRQIKTKSFEIHPSINLCLNTCGGGGGGDNYRTVATGVACVARRIGCGGVEAEWQVVRVGIDRIPATALLLALLLRNANESTIHAVGGVTCLCLGTSNDKTACGYEDRCHNKHHRYVTGHWCCGVEREREDEKRRERMREEENRRKENAMEDSIGVGIVKQRTSLGGLIIEV